MEQEKYSDYLIRCKIFKRKFRVNNNNNINDNNNNNDNDFGSVSGNADDVTVGNDYMAMVIVIVPPVGPPIPVVVGRASAAKTIFNIHGPKSFCKTVYLD